MQELTQAGFILASFHSLSCFTLALNVKQDEALNPTLQEANDGG